MAIYMWREANYLCFTANTANSTVKLKQTWSPTAVNLEISTDDATWSDYTIWDTITLSNVWDKVYMRNKSETPTSFSTWTSDYYGFVITWSTAASWDVNFLLCKNSTDTVSNYAFFYLFFSCSITTPPKLPATTLWEHCYDSMFLGCSSLITAPSLPATTLANNCYSSMLQSCSNLTQLPKLPATTLANNCYSRIFNWCSKIKLSTTQTWEYQTPYRIPTSWTGTTATNWNYYMLYNTWWTFTWTPSINTTYYTSNTIV